MLKKKASLSKLVKSSLYKKQQPHREGPLSKGFLLQKFHVNTTQEVPSNIEHTYTHTRGGSDLDVRQDSIHL